MSHVLDSIVYTLASLDCQELLSLSCSCIAADPPWVKGIPNADFFFFYFHPLLDLGPVTFYCLLNVSLPLSWSYLYFVYLFCCPQRRIIWITLLKFPLLAKLFIYLEYRPIALYVAVFFSVIWFCYIKGFFKNIYPKSLIFIYSNGFSFACFFLFRKRVSILNIS